MQYNCDASLIWKSLLFCCLHNSELLVNKTFCFFYLEFTRSVFNSFFKKIYDLVNCLPNSANDVCLSDGRQAGRRDRGGFRLLVRRHRRGSRLRSSSGQARGQDPLFGLAHRGKAHRHRFDMVKRHILT
jgi:hypothetical protein